MTQEEIESELDALRDQVRQQQQREAMRSKNWRSNGASARFCSLLFGLFGAGCFVAKALEALPLRETGIIGMVFVVTALPLSLLGAALREPVSARPEPR